MPSKLAELRKIVDAAIVAEKTVVIDKAMKDGLIANLTAAYAENAVEGLQLLQKRIGEWRDRKQFVTTWKPSPSGNVPEKLMLIVSELSEAMEAFRHLTPKFREFLADIGHLVHQEGVTVETPDGMEQQWVWYDNFCEELADTQVRLMELCDALDIDLGMETCRKMAVNETRAIKHGKEC